MYKNIENNRLKHLIRLVQKKKETWNGPIYELSLLIIHASAILNNWLFFGENVDWKGGNQLK
jgi:hypothetical protein